MATPSTCQRTVAEPDNGSGHDRRLLDGVLIQQIGHGTRIGRAVVTTPEPDAMISDADIQHMLQQQLTVNPDFPQADRNTVFFVYLPPGVAVVQGGSQSCQAFCGY